MGVEVSYNITVMVILGFLLVIGIKGAYDNMCSCSGFRISGQETEISTLRKSAQENNLTPDGNTEQRGNSKALNTNRDQESICASCGSKDRNRSNTTSTGESTGLVGGRWKLVELLGTGKFGEVFQAVDTETGEGVVVKLEPIPRYTFQRSTLPTESEVYKALNESSNTTGFAQILFYGRAGDRNALVMTRLGRSMEQLRELCGGKFSAKTVLMIGIQAVTRIEQLHAAWYAHYDIHTENLLVGEVQTQTLYLVDFGSARKLHRSNSSRLRRADILSLGKVLTAISSGKKVYWSGFEGKDAILAEVRKYCPDVPEETRFVGAFCELLFNDKCDYEYLRDILRAGLLRRHLTDDRMFDWMELSPRRANEGEGHAKTGTDDYVTRQANRQSFCNPALLQP